MNVENFQACLKLVFVVVVALYEIGVRIVPTKKDLSIISKLTAFYDKVIPNNRVE